MSRMLKQDIDTPALLIDLDLMEKNIETLADFFRGKTGKYFRPHYKTPKSPLLAAKQIESGAIGISCQKLGEAETLITAGITDVLITNEIVGDYKIEKLVSFRKRAPGLMVCVDNTIAAKALSEEALKQGVRMPVLVDVNVGQNRCGVAPGRPAVDLATEVSKLKGLELKGFQCYHGTLQVWDQRYGMKAKREEMDKCNNLIVETRELMEAAGLNPEIVSGAGTGTYKWQYPVMSEVQAGSYILMDWKYHITAPEFERALTVLTTVMSTPAPSRSIVDAGYKAASTDAGMPIVKDVEGYKYETAGDEHGILKPEEPSRELGIGEKVELYPSHCDTTINLYDTYYGIRDGEVEEIWPIAARGKSQ
ncbi:MAG: DSD1 family PLP-dependent enzyme [Desulfobacteraceae bacterium]|jgi:D-serine deaminase-like pyridoxal phosphate-dependent protein